MGPPRPKGNSQMAIAARKTVVAKPVSKPTKVVRADLVQASPKETDAEIEKKLNERFEVLTDLSIAATEGEAKALIVSGPAGLGKSFTVEKTLSDWDPTETMYTIVKGYVKTTGLIKLLYQFRHPNQVIVFDDADTVFYEDTSLNLLKAVCDTTDVRKVSYLAESNLVDDETGERLPRQFTFEGTIIFITNLDFDALIDKGHKLAPHLQALVSRSHYIDLAMKTKRDYIVRIKQVIKQGLLREKGMTTLEEADVVAFIDKYSDRLRELSLRMALKIGTLRKTTPAKWERMALITCCRNT